MIERGIARDGYGVLQPEGEADRLRHQRLACAVSEEEHRAGLCAGRSHRAVDTEVAVEMRDKPGEGEGGAAPFYRAQRSRTSR